MPLPGMDLDPAERRRLAERFRLIDGPTLRLLAEAGLTWLRANQEVVNALNVFPVPDGDTGTNMTLTMQAALVEAAEVEDTAVGVMARAIAHGALMGARGNSGVILSQLWRGLARGLDDLEVMDAAALAKAFGAARDTAYRGVVQPVEGTILTVAKDMARAAAEAASEPGASSVDVLEKVVEAGEISVARTPELLAVLRDAGVVDSGGKGLQCLLEGMLRAIYGLPLDEPQILIKRLSQLELEQAGEAITPGQDWEVIVDFRPNLALDVPAFYEQLGLMGTSIQVGEGDGIYRMHIHVPDQCEYEPVEYIKTQGTITHIRIENLMIQGPGSVGPPPLELAKPRADQIGAIVVSPGPGLSQVLASLGAAAVIDGGQTMNPSTQELLAAAEACPAGSVIILPNNKNVVMSARQAIDLASKRIAVVPSHTLPQGIAAMLAMDPDGELSHVAQAMEAMMESVRTVEVTTATRSAKVDGVDVEEGQVIGMLDDRMVHAGSALPEVLRETLRDAGADQAELVTVYYGADLTPQQAEAMVEQIHADWPHLQVEIHAGGQPHYPIIASVE